jgi:hypothetical protein
VKRARQLRIYCRAVDTDRLDAWEPGRQAFSAGRAAAQHHDLTGRDCAGGEFVEESALTDSGSPLARTMRSWPGLAESSASCKMASSADRPTSKPALPRDNGRLPVPV